LPTAIGVEVVSIEPEVFIAHWFGVEPVAKSPDSPVLGHQITPTDPGSPASGQLSRARSITDHGWRHFATGSLSVL
jgi:hypothetical protein